MPEKTTDGGVVAYNVESYNTQAIELVCAQGSKN